MNITLFGSNDTNLDFSHLKSITKVCGYISAILYLSGIILNVFCLVVLFKIKMHKAAVGLHLVCIAVTDIMALLVGITYNRPLQDILKISPINSVSNIFCKVGLIVAYPVTRASTWLITSATCERFLSISIPLKVKTWPMLKVTKIVITSIMLFASGEFLILLSFTYDICWYTLETEWTFLQNHQIYNSTVYFLTVVLVFILSGGIVGFLVLRKNISKNTQERRIQRITIMLFTIAVTFLLSSIVQVMGYITHLTDLINHDTQTFVNLLTATHFVLLFSDMYHWSNFVIYLVFLYDFRSCVRGIFRKLCWSRSTAESRSPTSTSNLTALSKVSGDEMDNVSESQTAWLHSLIAQIQPGFFM